MFVVCGLWFVVWDWGLGFVNSFKRVTSLYDGMNLIPVSILLRDGLLEDITRDYKIKKILEEK